MSDASVKLDELRQRIDQLDDDILRLISERANCAQQVAQAKVSEELSVKFCLPRHNQTHV